MMDRLPYLWPEIALFIATCVVMVLGLSRNLAVRRTTSLVAGVGVRSRWSRISSPVRISRC